MNESPPPRRPLVDPAVLGGLRDELQPGSGTGEVFVNNYIALLPRRLDRLLWAVESMDLEAAMDALLTLKTASLMVGACRMGSRAGPGSLSRS
jgi:histidine phosphotransfer protein HptB